jgi:hypothetical protein
MRKRQSLGSARQLVECRRGPQLGVGSAAAPSARAWAASRRAARAEPRSSSPASALSSITSSVALPVRRASARDPTHPSPDFPRAVADGARPLPDRSGSRLPERASSLAPCRQSAASEG